MSSVFVKRKVSQQVLQIRSLSASLQWTRMNPEFEDKVSIMWQQAKHETDIWMGLWLLGSSEYSEICCSLVLCFIHVASLWKPAQSVSSFKSSLACIARRRYMFLGCLIYPKADPGGRAVCVGLRPLARLLGLWAWIPRGAWMSVCCECCVVRWRCLRRADHLYRGVLPSMVCLSVIVKLR